MFALLITLVYARKIYSCIRLTHQHFCCVCVCLFSIIDILVCHKHFLCYSPPVWHTFFVYYAIAELRVSTVN